MAESVALADTKQVDYFKTKIQNQMNDFADEAKYNTNKAFSKTVLVIIFSGLTTVLIGIGQKGMLEAYREALAIGALITSAITSGFSAWESFFSYRNRWVAFTEAWSDARAIQEQLEYLNSSGHLTQAKLDELFREFQHVRDTAHTGWIRNTRDKKK